jgi:starch phosphorylase
VFLADYNVSLGQLVYPAADLSEQISTAGKEASGTGNMKFAMNGALTIGTLDGANIEIRDAVEAENCCLFGHTAQQVAELRQAGYHPLSYVHANSELQEILQNLLSGCYYPRKPAVFHPLINSLLYRDEYMVLADYPLYLECQEKVEKAYRDPTQWMRMSILNTARTGRFSSDRTIQEYATEIWKVKPVPVSLDTDTLTAAGQDQNYDSYPSSDEDLLAASLGL